MNRYSREAVALWNEYSDYFMERWGIDREVSALIGARSKQIFAAEFKERGGATYCDSVILPIRNAFYMASQIGERWAAMKKMEIVEPVLDYGCGVGFQLLWLKRHGFSELYGYEIPGIQETVMTDMLAKHKIPKWDGSHVETVLCTNVLEHVLDPVDMLNRLLTIGKRVIANICTDHESPHIAPHDQLEICRDMLKERGTLYCEA